MMTRIFSALVLIPFVIYSLWQGGGVLAGLLYAANVLALSEYFKFCKAKKIGCFELPVYVVSTLYFLNVHYAFENDRIHGFEFSPMLVLGFVFIFLWLQVTKKIENSIIEAAVSAFGFLYISVFLSFALYIRHLAHGRELLMTVVFIVWAADTFAYFGGMRFGRSGKKLSPEISPKKSVVGVYFGLFFSCAAAIAAFKYMNPAGFPFWCYIAMVFVINVFSVIGDLIESQFKRDCELKDSSGLIPGHGGVLDRVDSLLLALPVAYYYFVFMLR